MHFLDCVQHTSFMFFCLYVYKSLEKEKIGLQVENGGLDTFLGATLASYGLVFSFLSSIFWVGMGKKILVRLSIPLV